MNKKTTKRGRPSKKAEVLFFDELMARDAEPDGYTFQDLRNESDKLFVNISSERYCQYVWLNEDGTQKTLRFPDPVAVSVSPSGHRLFCADGHCYYIPFGWTFLSWEVKPGAPHFVK